MTPILMQVWECPRGGPEPRASIHTANPEPARACGQIGSKPPTRALKRRCTPVSNTPSALHVTEEAAQSQAMDANHLVLAQGWPLDVTPR